MDPSDRIAIFIDGSNLYKGLVSLLGPDYRLDFVQFINMINGGRKLLRAYYYNAPLPPEDAAAKAHQSFLNYLKRVPYVTVKLGRLERRADTFVEKGVDIQIAVDMMRLAFAQAFDVGVLVSGDGDFAEVVRVIQDMGIQMENTTFNGLSSYRLAQQADRFYALDSLPWESLRAGGHHDEEDTYEL